MRTYIISIGDELVIGQVINTNAADIAVTLGEVNIDVDKVITVGDDMEDIKAVFDQSMDEADVVMVTGGLGPTHDDITRDVVVEYFDTELVRDETVFSDIKARFEMLGRTVNKVNEDQCLVPKNAEILRNHLGTAPGYWIEQNEKVLIVMPGVPAEMKEMLNTYVVPKLETVIKGIETYTKRLTLLTTGIAESDLYSKLEDIENELGDAKLAFLPSPFGVRIRITVTSETEQDASDKISAIEQRIRGIAGRYIYGRDKESLAEVVGRLLTERGLTLSIAESCTGGNVCNLLTNYSGSSAFLERGVVSYSNGSKVELLEVDEDLLTQHGAVSIEVARQMAEGIRSVSGTELGLSITGILGPTGATPDKPVGLVIIGLADEDGCTVKKYNFGDDRINNKERATQAALDIVRKFILGIDINA